MLSIEGRIRDLALADVFQLLARGRKSGTLYCEAPLLSRAARVGFAHGILVDADVAPIGALGPWGVVTGVPAEERVEEAALDVLCWKDGTFRFVPADVPAARVHRAVEPLLIEAAQRAIAWDRIEALVPHARVVPAFEDLEPGQLPELRLSPPQWEVLAHVDGQRDLVALATLLQRELTQVAELVHDLIALGLLTLREAPRAPRRNPTPPVNAALPPMDDLWIPDRYTGAAIRMPGDRDETSDGLFDPIRVGVLTPEGLPALDLPLEAIASAVDGSPAGRAVAPLHAEPSVGREQVADAESGLTAPSDGPSWCRRGDAQLRAGDLAGAVACWQAAVQAGVPDADAERLRDVIALATRLNALVPH